MIGGTRFLGRSIVEAAIDRGHEVTMFNRGVHGRELFPNVPRLFGDRNSDVDALRGGTWDAAVDTVGYLPRGATLVADALAGNVRHYTFVSSSAVYFGSKTVPWTEDLDVREASPDELAAADRIELGEKAGESYGALYGPLKVSCEQVVADRFERALVTRPGLVIGPWDFAGDRFAYWPRRVHEGGEVLAPGDPDRPLQIVDVRDLARFLLDMISDDRAGIYNAVGPEGPLTLRELLETCRAVSASDATFTWVDDAFLVDAGVGRRELPLWSPSGARNVLSTTRAVAAGLTFRPLADTVADTLAWEHDHPQSVTFPRARERQLLDAWHEAAAPDRRG